jgi:hypothetical protein
MMNDFALISEFVIFLCFNAIAYLIWGLPYDRANPKRRNNRKSKNLAIHGEGHRLSEAEVILKKQ